MKSMLNVTQESREYVRGVQERVNEGNLKYIDWLDQVKLPVSE
jgi:hypothetical protein